MACGDFRGLRFQRISCADFYTCHLVRLYESRSHRATHYAAGAGGGRCVAIEAKGMVPIGGRRLLHGRLDGQFLTGIQSVLISNDHLGLVLGIRLGYRDTHAGKPQSRRGGRGFQDRRIFGGDRNIFPREGRLISEGSLCCDVRGERHAGTGAGKSAHRCAHGAGDESGVCTGIDDDIILRCGLSLGILLGRCDDDAIADGGEGIAVDGGVNHRAIGRAVERRRGAHEGVIHGAGIRRSDAHRFAGVKLAPCADGGVHLGLVVPSRDSPLEAHNRGNRCAAYVALQVVGRVCGDGQALIRRNRGAISHLRLCQSVGGHAGHRRARRYGGAAGDGAHLLIHGDLIACLHGDVSRLDSRTASDGRERPLLAFHGRGGGGVLGGQLRLHRAKGFAVITVKAFGNIGILQFFVQPSSKTCIFPAFLCLSRESLLVLVGEVIAKIIDREAAGKTHGADRRRQRGGGNILHMVLGVNGERALGFHCISISQVRIGLGDYHGRVHRGSHRCAAAAGGTDDVARHAGQCRWILGIGIDARDGAANVMGGVYGNGAPGLGDFLDGALVIIGDGALDEVRIAAGVGLGGSGDVI